MERFSTFTGANQPLHEYSPLDIAAMSDEGLVQTINDRADWDADLLADLIWRAFPDFDKPWEVGDAICYEAAEKLGFEI